MNIVDGFLPCSYSSAGDSLDPEHPIIATEFRKQKGDGEGLSPNSFILLTKYHSRLQLKKAGR